MRRRLRLACGLVVLLAAATSGQAMAATGPPSVPNAPSSQVTTAATRGVTLVTGDSVRLTKDPRGRTVIATLPARKSGPGAAFQTLTTGRHTYVIPASARPYLGRVLDPALFDVAAMSAAGARIPVRLTYSGATAPSVPGVTMTSKSLGAVSGFLTPKSARQFGTALAGQYAADARAHFPQRTSLFGATHVYADVQDGPRVVTPHYPMRTLIIKVLDRAGAPAPFAMVEVVNTDDMSKFADFAFVVDGEARMSVPLGTYGLTAAVDVLDPSDSFAGFALVTASDFVVSGQNQTVALEASGATSRLSVRTPLPADQQGVEFDVARTDRAGTASTVNGFALFGPGSIWIAPSGPSTSGTLDSSAAWVLTGAPVGQTPYSYSLHFDADAIPAVQSYAVAADAISTVNSRFYIDVRQRQGEMILYPFSPESPFVGGFGFPVALPGEHIEYVNAIPGAVWFTILLSSVDPFSDPFASATDDGPRLAPAGGARTAEWGRGPSVPNVPVKTDGAAASFGFDCPACRTADSLAVFLDFATDSTPGHSVGISGNLDGTPVTRFRLYRDDVLISDETDVSGSQVTVPATSGTYKLIDEVDRVPSVAFQSTSTSTEITFVSARGQGGTLPRTWTCSLGRRCTVLPLLRASVVLPVNLVGSVPIGASSVDLTLAHIAGARATEITSGEVQVRHPGAAWTTLPCTLTGPGAYRADLTTTEADAGTSYDLRILGTDAAGGRIEQTTATAFAVVAS